MRRLQSLLCFAARQLQHAPACGGHHSAQQLPAAARAAATTSHSAWINAADSCTSAPLGVARFATGRPPPDDAPVEAPHRGEREQSAAASAGDRQQLSEHLEVADALQGDGSDAEDLDGEAVLARRLQLGSYSDNEDGDVGSSDSDEDEIDSLLRGRRRQSLPQGGVLAEKDAENSMLEEIQQASKKRQRFLLQQRLSGSTEDDDGESETMRPPELGSFAMKVVDVNRTSKGGRAGRIAGYSSLVVVGNGNGVIGQGGGKSLEAKASVDKATRKALKHLTYVPRFRGHTVHYPTNVLFGKTKLIIYPKASGRGITANSLMRAICQLAGISDVGIKIQGSRNLRNQVQALFKAFDEMQARVDEDSIDATPSPKHKSIESMLEEALDRKLPKSGATAEAAPS